LDIGPDSLKAFQGALADAKTIIWNGPMGVFEFEKFAKGTFGVAETLAELSGKVIELLVSLIACTALSWVLVFCLLGMGHKCVEAVMQGLLASLVPPFWYACLTWHAKEMTNHLQNPVHS